ncbi:MAG: 23S rRNA (pseudouridine(1915)-N(3))-methyltransferase RlmH [Bacteroidales bacterium]|nr:23S rRNA (pseudouridine(1915)-N(3))-methyltransferase RlmH [Bacteroidales bacterium]
MKIIILAIGKTDEKFISEGIDVYLRRIKPFCPIEIEVISEPKNHNKLSVEEQMLKEALLLEQRITLQDVVIVLDEKGTTYSSVEFAKQFERWLQQQKRRLVFIIGGSFGIHRQLKEKYSTISLSAMTFNHQMVRLFLLEQIYRAFTIIKGHPYHK